MAEVTNTGGDTLLVPALGLRFAPGETVTVDDDAAVGLPAPFRVTGDVIVAPPAAEPAAEPEASAVPVPAAPADTGGINR